MEVTAMLEFLQSYGTWIILGVVFVLMLQMHGGGGGCGMSHGDQTDQTTTQPTDDGANSDQKAGTASNNRHTGGCH